MRRCQQFCSIRNICLALLIMLSLTMFSCNGEGNGQSETTLYWRGESSGVIDTNDLVKLQKQVPFNIVLPDYVPDDQEYPPNYRYSKDGLKDIEVNVTIYYISLKTSNTIFINEFVDPYLTNFLEPNLIVPYEFIYIDDIKVRIQHWVATILQEEKQHYLIKWEMNDVYFEIECEGYDQEIAMKIFRSMIK